MRSKIIALLGTIAICTIPALSLAATNVTVINNTDSYGTGALGSLCSNLAGDKGIIKPKSSITFDVSPVSMFCDANCEGYVYLSRDCSGKKLAKVIVNARKGIISVTNYDKGHYKTTFEANFAQIDPI